MAVRLAAAAFNWASSSSLRLQARGGCLQRTGKQGDGRIDGLADAAAGMRHQVVGANLIGALHLSPKGRDRVTAHLLIGGGEIDEVVVVDHQRGEVKPGAVLAHGERVVGGDRRGAPHTRTGGKDLEGVAAEIESTLGGVSDRGGDGDV
jgi:hypothetical protein